MSTAKIIEKVTKLIALTASSNDNEARNAAMQACRLIREHKLQFASEMSKAYGTPMPPIDLSDLFRYVNRYPQQTYADVTPRRPRRPKYDLYPSRRYVDYDGASCAHCGHVIYNGAWALFLMGCGMTHDSNACEGYWYE